jgi:hypothetical protein
MLILNVHMPQPEDLTLADKEPENEPEPTTIQ